MSRPSFSWINFALIVLLSLAVGAAVYGVVWQFNDGKVSDIETGVIILGMALPSVVMGGVMRLFRPDLQRYFAITALIFGVLGAFVLFF